MDPVRPPLRVSFARVCGTVRTRLGMSQQQVAALAGVSRGYVGAVESGRANPSLDVVERIANALGLVVEPVFQSPTVLGDRRQVDALHARCVSKVERRLRADGWGTAREVEIVHARSHGWIDLLAFDPRTGTLLVIEVKTRLDDLGAIERQLGWYERSAFDAARRLGWTPRRAMPWLLALATTDADTFVRDKSGPPCDRISHPGAGDARGGARRGSAWPDRPWPCLDRPGQPSPGVARSSVSRWPSVGRSVSRHPLGVQKARPGASRGSSGLQSRERRAEGPIGQLLA